MSDSVLLVYSGGLDSTVLLDFLCEQEKSEVRALSFRYGQKHEKELQLAAANCQKRNIPHIIFPLDLNLLMQSTLLYSGGKIPEGHYAEETMKQTVVPMRNLIFSSLAAGYAVSHGINKIALAVHAGDHTIYPDCRPDFFATLDQTLLKADWQTVQTFTPFLHLDKAQIVALGLKFKTDFSQTWTCYVGKEKPCGKCGSCTERAEAFSKNGAKDPLFP